MKVLELNVMIPVVFLPYLINNDATGISDADEAIIDDWVQSFPGKNLMFEPSESGGIVDFCTEPAIGDTPQDCQSHTVWGDERD